MYEITGELEKAPEKVGYWNIDDASYSGEPTGTCTAHVFRIHEREQVMTAAFYNGGVRVVDSRASPASRSAAASSSARA